MSAGDENYEAIRGELRRDKRKRCLDEEKSSKLDHHDYVPKTNLRKLWVVMARGRKPKKRGKVHFPSDFRFDPHLHEENITDATPKLNGLLQVRVVNYNLIGDENKQLGVVAQELEQVFPALIDESPDRDTEGNDLGTTTKSVKYSVFVPMLIKAIQEQQALIQDLTTRLVALEAK
jgi:hypothetical protein